MRNAYYASGLFTSSDEESVGGVAYVDDEIIRLCPIEQTPVKSVMLYAEDIVGLVAVGLAAMSLAEMTDIYELVRDAVELAEAKSKTAA